MRAMNEFQFGLVKFFLDGFKIPPKKLAKKWGIDRHEVYRVMLCFNYEVYAKDTTADEDVLLAVDGLR